MAALGKRQATNAVFKSAGPSRRGWFHYYIAGSPRGGAGELGRWKAPPSHNSFTSRRGGNRLATVV